MLMKLFYRKYGSGPPLIILHGLYGSSDNWVSVAKSISNRFTVFLPDQRNHGQSPHSPVNDYDSMKEDLYDFVNDLKLQKFFLAGHSMGGKTAVNFAMSWPEKLYGLLVADISPMVSESSNSIAYKEHSEILHSIISLDLSGIRSREEVESLLKSGIQSEKTRGFLMKNLKRESDNSFSWKLNAAALLENLDRIMEGIGSGDKEKTEITGFPVFFLKGEYSEYLPESDFIKIRRIFPAAEFIIIPRSGHWIHADNPEAIKNCLLKLLDNQ
jgi:pimeloyl-ACP methyl ester carboxylesterase